MTRLQRWLLGAALLAAVVLGALVLGIDAIAKRAVEQGAEQATGVDAGVSGAHVGLVRPSFRVRELRLANPEGFTSGDFVRVRDLRLRLPTRNLLAQEIRVPELLIEGLELELERGHGRSNYGEILRNLERGAQAEPAQAGNGRTFLIERVVVRDARARLRASPLPPLDLVLPEVVLRDVGGRGTGSENVAAIVRAVLVGVLGAVARDADGVPRELAGGLRELAVERGTGTVEELGRAASKTARDAVEGLGRLLRRD